MLATLVSSYRIFTRLATGTGFHTAIILEEVWGIVTTLMVAYEVNNVEFSTTGNDLCHVQKGSNFIVLDRCRRVPPGLILDYLKICLKQIFAI